MSLRSFMSLLLQKSLKTTDRKFTGLLTWKTLKIHKWWTSCNHNPYLLSYWLEMVNADWGISAFVPDWCWIFEDFLMMLYISAYIHFSNINIFLSQRKLGNDSKLRFESGYFLWFLYCLWCLPARLYLYHLCKPLNSHHKRVIHTSRSYTVD